MMSHKVSSDSTESREGMHGMMTFLMELYPGATYADSFPAALAYSYPDIAEAWKNAEFWPRKWWERSVADLREAAGRERR